VALVLAEELDVTGINSNQSGNMCQSIELCTRDSEGVQGWGGAGGNNQVAVLRMVACHCTFKLRSNVREEDERGRGVTERQWKEGGRKRGRE
jgi:hypothetical protein